MVIVSTMSLFAVMVVFRDIVREILSSRKANAAPTVQYVAVPTPIPAPEAPVKEECVPEPKKEEPAPVVEEPTPAVEEPKEEPAAEETVEEDGEGQVSFAKSQQQTLEERYFTLTPTQRGWYDEIIKYASAKEGSKRFKNLRYEEYKIGKNRLVRILIKRQVIHCEFILHNSDFKNYVNENKISVRQSATTMRIENAETVAAAKNSIDIVVAAIEEEKEYKKQQARERRKAQRAARETKE